VRVLDRLLYGDHAIAPLRGNRNFEFLEGDICDSAMIQDAVDGVRSVVALAALVGDAACEVNPQTTWSTNVEATAQLLDACRQKNVNRLVFASSCSVYGANGQELLAESGHLNPVSLYARTRIASEKLLKRNHRSVEVVILRLSTVCGLSERMRFDLMVNTLTACASMQGRVRVMGAEQWRPHLHVQDAAEAFVRAVEAPSEAVANDVFNVGTEAQNFTVGEVAAKVAEHIPNTIVEQCGAVNDPRSYRVSFQHIRKKLGFVPRRTVDDAIDEVHAVLRGVRNFGDEVYHNVKLLRRQGPERWSA
jgi:nucleoside-diphosphate-sugar epimerase